MWIHSFVLLIFCVLFFISKGFFSKSGEFLAGIFPDFLQLTKKQIRISLLIMFCGNLLGLCITAVSSASLDTVKDGYLIRNQKGEGSYEEEVIASDGTLTKKIRVVVEEVPYTESEINGMLDFAMDKMDSFILGENTSFERIEYPLNLIGAVPDTPITVEWNSDQPVYLDWEGALGEDVPKEGVCVKLTGELRAGEYLRVYERNLTVYPQKLSSEDAFVRELENQTELYGKEKGEYQFLPQEINGKTIIWSRVNAQEGLLITGISFMIGILFIFSEKSRKKEQRLIKEKEMKADYPLILNKLVLFMRAGTSSRQAVRNIVLEYQQVKKQTKVSRRQRNKKKEFKRFAYEELSRMYFEMEQGIPEEQAYERLGNRCNLMEYRTLSTLLIQNLKKGSSQFLPSLEHECRQAFEERKKRALIAGEEAGTKLLIPMILMLFIVLMMIIVPSFLTF